MTPARCVLAAALGLLVFVPGAGAAAGVDISVLEGQSFSGTVVNGLSCPLNSATITWGDGTGESAGTSDGNAGIQGTHTYAQAGTYAGSVSYTYAAFRTCPSGVQTASFQATVQDAPLSATGTDVSGTAGQSLSAVVANVDDANPGADPAQLSAQITWGDGTTTAGTVAAAAGGGFAVSGAHAYNTTGDHPIVTSIADVGGSSATANSVAHIGSGPPPVGGFPVNVSKPFISFSQYDGSFVCDAGTWQNLPPHEVFAYEWLRRTPASAVSIVARTRTFNPGGSAAHYVFSCRVTVPGFPGSTVADPHFTRLTPTEVPLSAYGNFRIRGIDVFQVVQPNSCAAMFSFPTGAFPCLAGGGTPTSYSPAGKLVAGADPQRTSYVGVQLDADKQTTAVVYVDRTELAVPGQQLEVTLKALAHGRQIGATLTRRLNQPVPYSIKPWVSASERATPGYGVQFQIPGSWLQVPARSSKGTIDLVATVGFPSGTPKLLAVECNPRKLTVKNLQVLVPSACAADNTFRLDRVPALHLLPLQIRSFELLGNGQNPGTLTAPDQVLSRARQLFPGGERMSVWPYAQWIGVRNQEALTATATPAQPSETAPVFACNGLRYASTAATKTTPAVPQTLATATRFCRMAAIDAVVTQWETQNPSGGFDATVGVHNYSIPVAAGTVKEPGWTDTSGHGTLAALKPGGVSPLFLVNDGSASRPLGAAAHEFGHVMGLPHASNACGGGAGGFGETWAPDQVGRLQGVEFDQSTPRPIRPVVDGGSALFDLMSYCGPEASLWLSPRNWNHAFSTLRSYAALSAATDTFSWTHQARRASSGQAFVVGVASSESARIVRVVQPHGPSAIPPTAPNSPLRVRVLDSAGRVLVDEGVQLQPLIDAPGAATFEAPVPVGAATVELIRHGVVLDRRQRNRSPHVRLLAPNRRARARAHGNLLVRWSAGDPESDQLQATVDYSLDGGRSWRTVYDGPSTGSVSVPGRFLEGSRRARIRVYVNDGFSEAHAVSPVFRADGTAPVVQIIRPASGEEVRGGQRTLLIGSALDDRHRALRGRTLTWFAGRHRLGSGEQIQVTLPAGRVVLRLVARAAGGRQTILRRVLHVIPAPVSLLQLRFPALVRHRARTIRVYVAASTTATLRTGGRRYRVGRRPRTIVVRLPRRPASGLLTLPAELTAGSSGPESSEHDAIVLIRS